MSLHSYYMDDCVVEIPLGFTDRTINVLDWPIGDTGEFAGLAIVREPLPPDPDTAPAARLASAVALRTSGFASQFPGFRLERDEVATGDTGGLEMRRKSFRWKKDQDVVYHHQVYVLIADTLVVFSGTSRAANRAIVDELVLQAANSLRVRER